MRSVIVDRFNGKPLEVVIERCDQPVCHTTSYTGSQAERLLAALNCILTENVQYKSRRKKPGILDKMTFIVIPNL